MGLFGPRGEVGKMYEKWKVIKRKTVGTYRLVASSSIKKFLAKTCVLKKNGRCPHVELRATPGL